MKKLLMLFVTVGLFLCFSLTACNVFTIKSTSDSATNDVAESGIPNPASVYCEENGNKLEIQIATDGSQSGACIFPDNSECDEWAYYRGECSPATPMNPKPSTNVEETPNASGGFMAPGASEPISDWWGVIKSTESGAQYDDYFERQDMGGAINFGIDSLDPALKAQIEDLRDSGKIVHLFGILFSNVADYNGSQIQVDRIEVVE